jgi:tRNA(adenine34) deaminase
VFHHVRKLFDGEGAFLDGAKGRRCADLVPGSGLDSKLMPVDHEAFMRLALAEAERAQALGEVPVGAVVVLEGRVVGAGGNQPIGATDPTAHAEIVALRAAAAAVGNYRLTGATLYVTVEPCLMCVGALVHARVREVVYGAPEPKTGALASAVRGLELPGLNHRFAVTAGVLEAPCRDLMQTFFRAKRSASAAP